MKFFFKFHVNCNKGFENSQLPPFLPYFPTSISLSHAYLKWQLGGSLCNKTDVL
jgi:hypothetical protein